MLKILTTIIALGFTQVFGLSGTIDSTNNHWGQGGNVASPVLIEDTIVIDNGTILTIEPGTQILISKIIWINRSIN